MSMVVLGCSNVPTHSQGPLCRPIQSIPVRTVAPTIGPCSREQGGGRESEVEGAGEGPVVATEAMLI
ncbi:hypothetical protein CA54_31240 [Symmachiella macrocystis]|uniref:Uncharacterized protein n=1 Tax=Symmachiella macrocystis TaxID=2527985 RepID=A0A5C6BPX9_9PLAN|nr:hypothetical protein CA54_31240 [Symmachiella macrocystis]